MKHFVNHERIIQNRRTVEDYCDAILQAYNAGVIVANSTLTIFGTGAERGTYGQFTNLSIKDIEASRAKISLSYFTDLYSLALRNQYKTNRKRTFYLTQMQEILPILHMFGLKDEFDEEWEYIKSRYAFNIRFKEYLSTEPDLQYTYLDLAEDEREKEKFLGDPRVWLGNTTRNLSDDQIALLIGRFSEGVHSRGDMMQENQECQNRIANIVYRLILKEMFPSKK